MSHCQEDKRGKYLNTAPAPYVIYNISFRSIHLLLCRQYVLVNSEHEGYVPSAELSAFINVT